MALLIDDERRDVFFPGEQYLLTAPESTGVFVCVTLDDDRLGGANDDDKLNDMSDLLNRLDNSLDGIAAINLGEIV